MAGSLLEVSQELGHVPDLFADDGELDRSAPLDLAPLEQGIQVGDPFPIVVDDDVQVRVLGPVALDDPFPGFHVSVVEQLVRHQHGIHGGHADTGPEGRGRRCGFLGDRGRTHPKVVRL